MPSKPSEDSADTLQQVVSPEYIQFDRKKLWEEFDKRLASIEARSIRAYFLNYSEAGFFEKWSRRAEWASAFLGIVGIIGYGISPMVRPRFRYTVARMSRWICLPLSGFLHLSVSWQNDLSPALALRAQKHVEAGSHWLQIHRQAKVYRLQLRQTSKDELDFSLVGNWCAKLAKDCYDTSKVTAIRAHVYKRFESYKIVADQLNKREKFLQDFLKDKQNGNFNENARVVITMETTK